jgi:hypothetical protein
MGALGEGGRNMNRYESDRFHIIGLPYIYDQVMMTGIDQAGPTSSKLESPHLGGSVVGEK